MSDYPFVCPVQVRWRDLDPFQHVNNSAFVTYLEVARAELWRDRFGSTRASDIPFVIARLEIDYKQPIKLYNKVMVHLRATNIAGASFSFEYRIEVEDQLAATARTLQVCVDPANGHPCRVPDKVRSLLDTLCPQPLG